MTEISYEEFLKASEIVERFKYQQDKTVQVSLEYDAKIYVTVKVPNDLTIEEVKEVLNDGYYDFEKEDAIDIRLVKLTSLILNGEEIDLNK